MRAIVTGGAGFIGCHVARALLARDHRVLVLDDLSGGFESNIPKGAEFERWSVTDELDPLFQRFKPDAVYHLAAYAAEGLSHHIPVFNYTNNLVGTANVLGAGYRAGITHFVFTSSIAVFGHGQFKPLFANYVPSESGEPRLEATKAQIHVLHESEESKKQLQEMQKEYDTLTEEYNSIKTIEGPGPGKFELVSNYMAHKEASTPEEKLLKRQGDYFLDAT